MPAIDISRLTVPHRHDFEELSPELLQIEVDNANLKAVRVAVLRSLLEGPARLTGGQILAARGLKTLVHEFVEIKGGRVFALTTRGKQVARALG